MESAKVFYSLSLPSSRSGALIHALPRSFVRSAIVLLGFSTNTIDSTRAARQTKVRIGTTIFLPSSLMVFFWSWGSIWSFPSSFASLRCSKEHLSLVTIFTFAVVILSCPSLVNMDLYPSSVGWQRGTHSLRTLPVSSLAKVSVNDSGSFIRLRGRTSKVMTHA